MEPYRDVDWRSIAERALADKAQIEQERAQERVKIPRWKWLYRLAMVSAFFASVGCTGLSVAVYRAFKVNQALTEQLSSMKSDNENLRALYMSEHFDRIPRPISTTANTWTGTQAAGSGGIYTITGGSTSGGAVTFPAGSSYILTTKGK